MKTSATNQNEYRDYLKKWVPFAPVPETPEISLHHTDLVFYAKSDDNFSVVAWHGGAWLARYILDHPNEFAGRKIIDVGSGGGLAAIAASMVGGIVTGIDADSRAIWGARINAEKNGASVNFVQAEWQTQTDFSEFDIITTTDTFYDKRFAKSFFEAINPRPFTLYTADGSALFDLHELKTQMKVLLEEAEVVSLQTRTDEEVADFMATAVKIVSPGLPAPPLKT